MALKKKITKAEFEKLTPERQKDYKAGEFSDTYVLDLSDDDAEDDPAELRRALAREKADRKAAQKELKAAKAKLAETGEAGEEEDEDDPGEANDPPPRGNRQQRRQGSDVKTIDRDWKRKYDKDTGELTGKLSQKDAFIQKTMIDGTANAIAAKISTSPELLSPAIMKRLTVDFEGDEPELVILGEDGKPSGMTLDKLEKEFVANKKFAAIIIGSKASGGGAPRTVDTTKPGGGAPAPVADQTADLSKLTPKDLAATLKARKEAATA